MFWFKTDIRRISSLPRLFSWRMGGVSHFGLPFSKSLSESFGSFPLTSDFTSPTGSILMFSGFGKRRSGEKDEELSSKWLSKTLEGDWSWWLDSVQFVESSLVPYKSKSYKNNSLVLSIKKEAYLRRDDQFVICIRIARPILFNESHYRYVVNFDFVVFVFFELYIGSVNFCRVILVCLT